MKREGIVPAQFSDKFFRLDFEAEPLPVLSLYPIPSALKLTDVTLDVAGLEKPPRFISWNALRDLPRIKLKQPLICQIFNWLEEPEWEGVRLVDFLDAFAVETHPEGYFAFYSRDRLFFEGLSRDEARDPRVLLAYGLNGAPLPEVYGGPLRLVVPFMQGYKSVKWLAAIHGFRNDPIGIKRLLGQSPTGQLNKKWKTKCQITLPDGKMGDPPLFAMADTREAVTLEEAVPLERPGPAFDPVEGDIKMADVSEKGKSPIKKFSKGLLKEVVAVIRQDKHIATRHALEAIGIYSYTTLSVLGRSRQRGLRYQDASGKEVVAIRFLPKQFFSIMVDESRLKATLAAIIHANRTGKGTMGDGRIFVLDLDEAIRIRTDERGVDAL